MNSKTLWKTNLARRDSGWDWIEIQPPGGLPVIKVYILSGGRTDPDENGATHPVVRCAVEAPRSVLLGHKTAGKDVR